MPVAAIYARVSSDRQREENTIASQTATPIGFARSRGYQVPAEWVFEDEGYSGASLVRPDLERYAISRRKARSRRCWNITRPAEPQICLSGPTDRRARTPWRRNIFIKAPQAATAEDQLVVQFQGMIAEYERAQILERSRRGKRHRARQGQINVLSGAPYGYRYVRKSDDAAARYNHRRRSRYRPYGLRSLHVAGMSIGAITRLLNERGVPTRKQISRWERSTVWAMLRNPAYKGTACFGKTETAPRQRITRRSGCAAASVRATALTTSGLAPNGSRLRSHRSSRRISSRGPGSCWSKTRCLRRGGQSRPVSCKGWCRAANAAMRCRAHRPARAHATSTTTDALVPTLGVILVVQCAIIARSAKTCSIMSSGMRLSVCWRIPT